MGDHIKTEVDIMKDFKWNYDNKWVSLSWLKEQINEKAKDYAESDTNYPGENDAIIKGLKITLSLLEENK